MSNTHKQLSYVELFFFFFLNNVEMRLDRSVVQDHLKIFKGNERNVRIIELL